MEHFEDVKFTKYTSFILNKNKTCKMRLIYIKNIFFWLNCPNNIVELKYFGYKLLMIKYFWQ